MPIPDFLKRENVAPIDKVSEEFDNILKEYKRVFDKEIGIEMSSYSLGQWIDILKHCIKENKTYEELTGDIPEEDALI